MSPQLRGVMAAIAAVACASCDETQPLAGMANKQLSIYALILEGGGWLTVNLIADGCPLLAPGTVEATANGLPMVVDPGRHGTFLEAPCYYPAFELSPVPPDIGSPVTIVIEDHSQALKVVMSPFHARPPALEEASTLAILSHRGDTVSFSFSAPPDDPPDRAEAWFSVDDWTDIPDGSAPCYYKADAVATLGDGRVDVVVPTEACFGAVHAGVCLDFTNEPLITTCENATCTLGDFDSDGCAYYPVVVQR